MDRQSLSYRIDAKQLTADAELRNIITQQDGVHMNHRDVFHQPIIDVLHLVPQTLTKVTLMYQQGKVSNMPVFHHRVLACCSYEISKTIAPSFTTDANTK